MIASAELEPTPRDPKKLRRTAWILVAIMVIGGVLILKAYEEVSREQSADTRPSKFHRIREERDLRVIRQDGKTADLFELRGKVWAVNVVSLANPEVGNRSREVMKRIASKYSSIPDFHLVSLVVDPPDSSETVKTLSKTAADQGFTLPKWWLATNEARTLHKFIKQELKANRFPHQDGGVWSFDTSIVLVDREGNLRRAVVPQQRGGQPYVATFDFDEAASWDERKVKVKEGSDITNQEQLALLLENTIDTLLAEGNQAQ